jgi:glycine/D-amino acid oxidase-like deaminating enzyme
MGTVRTVDCVVVGAGALGASVAYHAAARGISVALVDRGTFVSETSPRAAGLAVQVRSDESFSAIAKRSVDKIVGFRDETGERLTYSQTGSVAIARTEAAADRVRSHPALASRNGITSELVDAADARRLAPYADARHALAISYTPTDLHLEPGDLPRAYVRAAERLGVRLLPDTAVTGFVVRNGHVAGVRTRAGSLEGSAVVVCAGGWIGALMSSMGVELPLALVRHQLIVTGPIKWIDDTHAAVRVVDANVYARPYRGGLMFGGYESRPGFLETSSLPAHADELVLDFDAIDELLDRTRSEFPVLQGASAAEFRGGIPTLTPDGQFLIDELPGVQRLWVITGCNVGGLSTSPAIGEAVADWVVTGVRPDVLERFGFSRFGERWRSHIDALHAEARSRYALTEYG